MKIEIPKIAVENGGYFVNQGNDRHIRRVIASHELIFVTEGVLKMREGDRQWEIHPGETLILEPYLEHEGVGDYPREMKFYWLHFSTGKARTERIPLPKRVTLQRPERMTELFRRFLQDQDSGYFPPQERSAYLLLMLLELQRARPEGHPAYISRLYEMAIRHIQKYACEGVSTTDIAHALRVNPDYLGRVFKRGGGISLMEAVHREQIRHARQLLRETANNIEEVATASGFRDPSYFRRVFQAQEGLSPRNYRKLYTR